MQLKDLYKPIDAMSDEQLMERLREIRHNRTVVKPAKQARAKKEAKKGAITRERKAESLLAGLSKDEIRQLLLELGN